MSGDVPMSDEDPYQELHLYEGDSAFVVRENGNKTLYGVQLPELLALFAEAASAEEPDVAALVERLKIEACEDLDGEVRESAIEAMMQAAAALSRIQADNEHIGKLWKAALRNVDKAVERVAELTAKWIAEADHAEAAESRIEAANEKVVLQEIALDDLCNSLNEERAALSAAALQIKRLERALTDAEAASELRLERLIAANNGLEAAALRERAMREGLEWYANLPKEWTVNAGGGMTYGTLHLLGEKARAILADTGGRDE